MAILVSEMSRVLVQGLTGSAGQNFAENMRLAGTNLVAGVRPGRGGTRAEGVPVYDTVAEAVRATGATASVIAVPAKIAAEAAHEAMRAGIELAIIYAEGVAVHDALRLRALGADQRCVIVGPNSAGVMSPGIANLSDMRAVPMVPGPVGLVSKSGTLTYEVISDLAAAGIGISTVMCVGGDPVVGTTPVDAVTMFLADQATEVVVLLGEPGGSIEVDAARQWAAAGRPIPLVALIVGQAMPPGREFGHAGAVARRAGESAADKMASLSALGAQVVPSLADVPLAVQRALGR